MTILKNKKYPANLFFVGIMGVLVLGGTLAIREYNALVDARHDARTATEDIATTKDENADLQNTLYAKTDPVELEKIAQENAMVLETRPGYLSVKQRNVISRR